VIRIVPAGKDTQTIDEHALLQAIREEGPRLALIMIGGVNYYTGQVFDMAALTRAAHDVGAYAGFDLAHAIGNIELHLHGWNVDFAAWCSYKYLNSGPGGVAGAYIHERHARSDELFRLAGWWGTDKAKRFLMEPEFQPIASAESWQLSNAPVLSMAAHKASLDLFDQAGIQNVIAKSRNLTAYAASLLARIAEHPDFNNAFTVITPTQRGAQLSLLFHRNGKAVFDALSRAGVIADWREPNVIRIAPAPLYNTYSEVKEFAVLLEEAVLNEIGEDKNMTQDL